MGVSREDMAMNNINDENQIDLRAISKMSGDIKIDWDKFEPTDSQGYEMEGIVTYQDKDYSVNVSALADESYEIQVATQIYKEMLSERAVGFESVDADLGIEQSDESLFPDEGIIL